MLSLSSRSARTRARRSVHWIIGATLVAVGCDSFFGARGSVTDCDTGEPVANAVVTLTEEPPDDSDSATTDAEGRFEVTLNLSVTHPDYQRHAERFAESPSAELDVCLVR